MSEFESVDLSDPALFAQGPPYELFSMMREEAPVHWSPAPDRWNGENGHGFWNLTRARDIEMVLRDWETFSSYRGGFCMRPADFGSLEFLRTLLIGQDPPEHSRMRGVMKGSFTPARADKLEPQLRATMNRVLDDVVERGECDVVSDVFGRFATETLADLLGVPLEDRPQLMQWEDMMMRSFHIEVGQTTGTAAGEGEVAMRETTEYLMGLIEERRQRPRQDLITHLAHATYDDTPVPVPDLVGLFFQLFIAGVGTSRATMAIGLHTLLEHPEQLRDLRDDPRIAAAAVEEILRWTCVPLHMRRTATCDTEIAGQSIREGDSVVMWLCSATRDPAVIPDPDTFDIHRPPFHQFAFGGGRHFCLGAPLGRVEIRVGLTELLRRMPDIELAAPPTRFATNIADGYKRMPVTFTPDRQDD